MSQAANRCPACNAIWRIEPSADGGVLRCPKCGAWVAPAPAAATDSQAAPKPPGAAPLRAAPVSGGLSARPARPGRLALQLGLLSLGAMACCCGLPFLSAPLAVAGLLIGCYGIKQAGQGEGGELNLSIAGVAISGLSLVLGIGFVTLSMISGAVQNRNAAEREDAVPVDAPPSPAAEAAPPATIEEPPASAPGRIAPERVPSEPAELGPETPEQKTAPVASGDAQIVYVTRTGADYHRDGCLHLRQSRIPLTLGEARRRYTPCQACLPPSGEREFSD